MKFKLPNLSKRVRVIVAASVIVAGASSVAAFNAFQPATADVMTPTQVTVQEHDSRLDKNEADIAETKERVNEVEQKADSAAQEVKVVKERVTVVEKQVAQPAPQVQQPVVTPAPTPSPAPDYNSLMGCGVVTMEESWEVDCKTGERLTSRE